MSWCWGSGGMLSGEYLIRLWGRWSHPRIALLRQCGRFAPCGFLSLPYYTGEPVLVHSVVRHRAVTYHTLEDRIKFIDFSRYYDIHHIKFGLATLTFWKVVSKEAECSRHSREHLQPCLMVRAPFHTIWWKEKWRIYTNKAIFWLYCSQISNGDGEAIPNIDLARVERPWLCSPSRPTK